MVSTFYFRHAAELIAAGKLDERLIDESVRHILRMKFRLGLFDSRPTASGPEVKTPSQQSLATATGGREPGAPEERRQCFAGGCEQIESRDHRAITRMRGTISSARRDGWPDVDAVKTPLVAFREMLGETHVAYAPGLKKPTDDSRDGFAEALGGGKVRYRDPFPRRTANVSGEAHFAIESRSPRCRTKPLVDEIAKAGKPIVVVMFAGRPLTFRHVAEKRGPFSTRGSRERWAGLPSPKRFLAFAAPAVD